MEIQLKRIYQVQEESDGFRILVDRIYPRGIKKEDLQVDLWDKEIAPSSTLRKSFHTTGDFETFKESYLKELALNKKIPEFLQLIRKEPNITLLTASKDVNHCQLPILKEFIEKNL